MRIRKQKIADILKSPQYVIMLLVGFMVLWMVGSATVGAIHNKMISKMVIESEFQDVNWETYAFINPEESLVKSDVSGDINHITEQSNRVAKNELVFSVKNKNSENENDKEKYFYAPFSGIVSYDVDGYEEKNSLDDIKNMDLYRIYEDNLKNKDKKAPSKVSAGAVHAKVIDNLQSPYLFFQYYPDKNTIFSEVGDSFRIRFPDLSEEGVATVEEIRLGNDGTAYCKVKTSPMSDVFLQKRVVKAVPYRIENAKLRLNKNMLVYSDDRPGVYILENRVVRWKEINIEEEYESDVLCKTLPKGTVIITSPKRVELGDIVK